jgi:hypothetical protein
MDINTIMRLCAHYAAIGLLTAMIFALIMARGSRVKISHIPLAVASMTLFALWLFLLSLSIRSVQILPREAIVSVLAMLELGGTVLGWAWFAMAIRFNFRLRPRASLGVET